MSTINPLADKLKGKIPESVRAELTHTIFDGMSALRLAHFLAQCDHESAGFRVFEENLNYSATGLRKTFKKYFDTMSSEKYAHHPELIASRVYADRMGNGAERTGEGWKYRGRGYIMLTGRDAYNRCGMYLGADLINKPELVASAYPLSSALWFFEDRKIWGICDKGAGPITVTEVTHRVNGGENGLEQRIEKFNYYWRILQ